MDCYIFYPSDTFHRLLNVCPFELQLFFIGYVLPLTTAAISKIGAWRLFPIRRGDEEFYKASLRVISLLLVDLSLYPVPRDPASDKDHKSIQSADPLATVSHIFYS